MRKKILICSHVVPLKRASGQEQRVYYTLEALRQRFHISFATVASPSSKGMIAEGLGSVVDEIILVEPQFKKYWHDAAALFYQVTTGLKRSNYQLGRIDLSPGNIRRAVGDKHFDCVLFEYWHAAAATEVFRQQGVPCILDQHNVLWRSYEMQLNAMSSAPGLWKRWALDRYRRCEQESWRLFDGIISINRAELNETRAAVPSSIKTFHAPMGTDISRWEYQWDPSDPSRLMYYGSLASPHNRRSALKCYREIMPRVWQAHPKTELWIVGSNPSSEIMELAQMDARVKVTGFVSDVAAILKTARFVLCPWVGTYGFRSRLIETMALGVPIVASEEAVYGMEIENGEGILLGNNTEDLIDHTLRLLSNGSETQRLSRLARQVVESRFSLDATYGRFVDDLDNWLTSSAVHSRH